MRKVCILDHPNEEGNFQDQENMAFYSLYFLTKGQFYLLIVYFLRIYIEFNHYQKRSWIKSFDDKISLYLAGQRLVKIIQGNLCFVSKKCLHFFFFICFKPKLTLKQFPEVSNKMKGHQNLFWNKSKYATQFQVWKQKMHLYAGIFKLIFKSIKFLNVLKLFKIMQNYLKICKHMQRNIKIVFSKPALQAARRPFLMQLHQ